jgi:hypothetical protein
MSQFDSLRFEFKIMSGTRPFSQAERSRKRPGLCIIHSNAPIAISQPQRQLGCSELSSTLSIYHLLFVVLVASILIKVPGHGR